MFIRHGCCRFSGHCGHQCKSGLRMSLMVEGTLSSMQLLQVQMCRQMCRVCMHAVGVDWVLGARHPHLALSILIAFWVHYNC